MNRRDPAPPRASRRGLGALALAALLVAACAPPRVDFARVPQELSIDESEYETIRGRWSRHLHVTHRVESALDAYAILLAPEYRAAYVGKVAAMRKLPPEARAALVEEQRTEMGNGVEVWVGLETSMWEWNDLSSPNSVWTVTLADDTGRSVLPVERNSLSHKPAMLAALFREWTPFARAWRLRFPAAFPDGTPVLGPATRQLSIRFAGPLGSSEARWQSAGAPPAATPKK